MSKPSWVLVLGLTDRLLLEDHQLAGVEFFSMWGCSSNPGAHNPDCGAVIYVIYGTRLKMKMWNPLFKNY